MLGLVKWLLLDIVLVSVFAVVGRLSHDEAISMAGWWSTAWPFLTGALLGWAVVLTTRIPVASARAGLTIWAGSIVAGMLLRQATDQGTAAPFVVVATVVLGLVLLGPRFLAARLGRPAAAP